VDQQLLADAASNLYPARMQMAFSLGWHIIFSCFGITFPALVLFAEWRAHRRADADLERLAHTWAKAMGAMFAAGAVSGTILSFEMGILWPGLMDRFGEVFGFPFILEGFTFFIEAIFLGIYLFSWGRLSPRVHLLTGLPIIPAGLAGAFFVISANGWMNTPDGFDLDATGRVVNVDVIDGMFNRSTMAQWLHMIVAAFMVVGFTVASIYAVGMLRGKRTRYHRLGLIIPLTLAAIATPVQIGVGDYIANVVADTQPVKLAAMEGLYHTDTGVPLSLGGIYTDNELRYALEIPWGLSLLVTHDPNGQVVGLETVPAELRPPVNVVHLSYNAMVGIGFTLMLITLAMAWTWWRHRRVPEGRWFLRGIALSGVASIVAMEAGWITTEVGRQPWVVYNHLKTADAVSTAPGLYLGLWAVLAVYAVLTFLTIYTLRRLARHPGVAVAPQEVVREPLDAVDEGPT
jgi:cytochrome bd ubiquinol oxidase subunit I